MSIRRITVLQEPAGAPAALDVEAEIAASLEAELAGLFVEDLELLRFAALPFAREIGASPAISRRMDSEAMERALRSKSEQARRALQAAAGRRPVRWSFSVVRGVVVEQLCAAVSEADLVIFSTRTAAHGRLRKVAMLSAAAQDALVAPPLAHLADRLTSEFDLLLLGAGPEALARWLRAARSAGTSRLPQQASRVQVVGGQEDLAGRLKALRNATGGRLIEVNPAAGERA